MGAGTHALVSGDANGQPALHAGLAVLHHHGALHRTHAEEEAGGTKVVDVVIHMVQANGGVVGDVHAGVEGQLVQQRAGAEAVAIQQAHQRHDGRGQARHRVQNTHQLVQEVLLLHAAVGLDGLVHAVTHVVEGIGGVKAQLHSRFAALGILGILQHREGHGAVVAGVILLVHDVAVDLRVLAHRADKGRHDDLHEGHLFALGALLGNVARQHFVVHLVLQKHLGVAAHGHQVGRDADNGIDGGDTPTIGTESKHRLYLASLSMMW